MVVRPVHLHDFEFRLGRPSGEIQTGRVHSRHPVAARQMQYVRNDLGTQDISDLKGKIEKIKSFPKDKLVFGGKTLPTSAGLSFACRPQPSRYRNERRVGHEGQRPNGTGLRAGRVHD